MFSHNSQKESLQLYKLFFSSSCSFDNGRLSVPSSRTAIFSSFKHLRCVQTTHRTKLMVGLKHEPLIRKLHFCVVTASEADPLVTSTYQTDSQFLPHYPLLPAHGRQKWGSKCRTLIQTCWATLHHQTESTKLTVEVKCHRS